jgi:FAD synthetase
MIFGTFDMVHPGHENFFVQARKLTKKNTEPYLIVSLAREKNVRRIKGKTPTQSEQDRKKLLSRHNLIDKVVLGAIGNHIPHIVKQNPDVIALGYDQTAYVQGLRTALSAAGLKTKIVRLKPFHPEKYKTSLLL